MDVKHQALPLRKDYSEFSRLPDSNTYIEKLESKLFKIKGSAKEINSKDMLSVMQSARDDHMAHMISSSKDDLSCLSAGWDEKVHTSFLEKKLFPEKIGVTYEELQNLLALDVLANISEETNKLNESSVER